MRFEFRQVDVFSSHTLRGNPVAVVHGADELSTAQMQRFANWTNLSETTFLLRPTQSEADYRLRIFTTRTELPFAGHPTLGSAHAWREAGGTPHVAGQLTQECGAGLVKLHAGKHLAFAAPPLSRYEPVEAPLLDRIAEMLGVARDEIVDASWIVNGPRWIGVRLESAARVLELRPDLAANAGRDLGVVGPYPAGQDPHFEVRGLAGTWEDPVTGSLNAGLARWLIDTGAAPARYTASQGQALGRAGHVQVAWIDDTIWVGGNTTSVVRGFAEI